MQSHKPQFLNQGNIIYKTENVCRYCIKIDVKITWFIICINRNLTILFASFVYLIGRIKDNQITMMDKPSVKRKLFDTNNYSSSDGNNILILYNIIFTINSIQNSIQYFIYIIDDTEIIHTSSSPFKVKKVSSIISQGKSLVNCI